MIVSETVPLDKFDHDLSTALMKADKARGMKFHLNSRAVGVRKSGERYEVDVEDHDGRTTTLATDRVIHCAGRMPNLEELDLKAAGVEYDEQKGMKVNKRLRTNLDHVYAVGDCTDSGLPLTPVGSYEADILSDHLFRGGGRDAEYFPIPTVAFCLPEIAAVGMTQAEADEAVKAGRKIRTNFELATEWFYPQHLNSPVMAYKVFIDEDKDTILGGHLLGPRAAEVVNLLYLAIKSEIRVSDYRKLLFAYPTVGASTKNMLA